MGPASGRVSYVDSSGSRVEVTILDGTSRGLAEGEMAFVGLKRIAYEPTRNVLQDFAGEWRIAVRVGAYSPNLPVSVGMPARAMREADWQVLADRATEILTMLGVGPGQSRATVLEQVLILRSAAATAVPTASWGEIKARVR